MPSSLRFVRCIKSFHLGQFQGQCSEESCILFHSFCSSVLVVTQEPFTGASPVDFKSPAASLIADSHEFIAYRDASKRPIKQWRTRRLRRQKRPANQRLASIFISVSLKLVPLIASIVFRNLSPFTKTCFRLPPRAYKFHVEIEADTWGNSSNFSATTTVQKQSRVTSHETALPTWLSIGGNRKGSADMRNKGSAKCTYLGCAYYYPSNNKRRPLIF